LPTDAQEPYTRQFYRLKPDSGNSTIGGEQTRNSQLKTRNLKLKAFDFSGCGEYRQPVFETAEFSRDAARHTRPIQSSVIS
jgi:phosphodiesterase/alkaline phosphatase D-like protein